jgi:hypothetical protein
MGRMGLRRGAAANVAIANAAGSILGASGGADGHLVVPWGPPSHIDLTEDDDDESVANAVALDPSIRVLISMSFIFRHYIICFKSIKYKKDTFNLLSTRNPNG